MLASTEAGESIMKYFILSIILASSFTAFGHGENVPGPHGGSIQMPGPFHTELLITSDIVKVYLLDMAFKNPITENSNASLTVKSKTKSIAVACNAKKTFFECPLPIKASEVTEVKLNAVRKGLKSKEASYSIPLLFNRPASQAGHEQHH